MNGGLRGRGEGGRVPVGQWSLWLFDMDGTLTRAAHDFPAIKIALDLPAEKPILEALAELPEDEAAWRWQRLDEIEWEIATRAEGAQGADELLGHLRDVGCRLGLVTRNNRRTALRTLEVAGLGAYFGVDDIVGREDAHPKPAPDGIHRLMRRDGVGQDAAVLVGDYRFDLMAARAAGIACILVDGDGDAPWRDLADICVPSLIALRALLDTRA